MRRAWPIVHPAAEGGQGDEDEIYVMMRKDGGFRRSLSQLEKECLKVRWVQPPQSTVNQKPGGGLGLTSKFRAGHGTESGSQQVVR